MGPIDGTPGTLASDKNIDSYLTFGSATKSDKSKDRKKDEGWEFEEDTEDFAPAADRSLNRDQTQHQPQA